MITKLCGFLLTMSICSQGISGNINWSLPSTLSMAGVDATDPRVVIDVKGNVTAVWIESGLVKASTKTAGGSWQISTTLSNPGASSPRLSIDRGGNVVALWVEEGVVKSAMLPLNSSWSCPVDLSKSGASSPELAVDYSGNAVAVWMRNGCIESSMQLFGKAWGEVSLLSESGADSPSVAIGSNGTVAVTWHSSSSGDAIATAIGSISGAAWDIDKAVIPLPLSLNHHHHFPKVVVDESGNATTLWFRYGRIGSAYTNVAVLASTLMAGARSWSAPVVLSGTGLRNPADLQLRLGVDEEGNLLAVWTNSYDGETFSIESAEKKKGGEWTEPALPTVPNLYSFQVDLSLTSKGKGLITYMGFDGVSSIGIFSQEIDSANPFSASWSAPVSVSQVIRNGYPYSGFTASGNTANAVAIWESFNGMNTAIQVSTGAKTMVPSPTDLSVVQQASDFGVFTEYYNTLTWTASPSPNIIQYNIYRNGVFFTAVDANTLQVVDHNAVQGEPVTYGVAALDNTVEQSEITTMSFPNL